MEAAAASILVGREAELASAHAFLAGASGGMRALLVEGDPGIGKTALWRAVVSEADGRGCRVLACAGGQAEARLSFAGLTELLGDGVDETLASLPPVQREALEVALALRAAPGQAPDAKTIGMGLRSLLAALAARGPVLVAVDDLQWLDRATVRALAFAAKRMGGHPVGLLVTVRTPADPLGVERALGWERFARLRLGPLSAGALRVLLEERLGYRYPRPVLLRVAEVSGGNPLFALEFARALGPAPALEPGAPLPVPESLRELLAERLAQLGPAGRKSLLAAAALSRASEELVERASSARGLEEAEEAGLLRVSGGRVVFAHPLYGAAVYEAAASRRRRAMHARLAALVREPEDRARHLALATRPPDEEVAAALAAAAADAAARGALDATAELMDQARRFTPTERAELARERGVRAAEQYIHAGDRPRARALLERLLAETPAGPLRAEALKLLAEVRHNEANVPAVMELLAEALEHSDDPALRTSIELTRCYVCVAILVDFAAADGYAERALAEASRLPAGPELAEALAVRQVVNFVAGKRVDWDAVERSLALEDPKRVVPVQMRPRMIAANLEQYSGRLAAARRHLGALRRLASDSGDESDLAYVLCWLAWTEIQAGNLAAAVALAEQARVEAELSGSDANVALALAQGALARAHLGEETAARAAAAEAAAACEAGGFGHPFLFVACALALLELSLGDSAAAWQALQPIAGRMTVALISDPAGPDFLAAATEALVGLDDLDRAERLLAPFEGRARELERPWALATTAYCRGLLEAARGDLAAAERALVAALGEYARLDPLPFALARTLLAQGQVRRRRREWRAARETLERAAALFDEVGARRWEERARDELARIGGRGRRQDGEVTAAERRVAALAAEGLTNREIAARLHVSVNTVERHLAHVYAKLGVHSRTQLAARRTAAKDPGLP
jgi:DNA-binding CsgD family transcriptional regulator